MTATLGEKIKLTIFGESHGLGIGCVIDGLPPGFAIDLDAVKRNAAPCTGQKPACNCAERERRFYN